MNFAVSNYFSQSFTNGIFSLESTMASLYIDAYLRALTNTFTSSFRNSAGLANVEHFRRALRRQHHGPTLHSQWPIHTKSQTSMSSSSAHFSIIRCPLIVIHFHLQRICHFYLIIYIQFPLSSICRFPHLQLCPSLLHRL